MTSTLIKSIRAREVLDSRGNPTVSAEVELEGGIVGDAMVPAGASVGTYEAQELRDGDLRRFGGKGVRKAVINVQEDLGYALRGFDAVNQTDVDRALIEADGSENKSNFGANSLLAVSLAVARAATLASGKPLYRHINQLFGDNVPLLLPVPMINMISGGSQARNTLDFQEFMICPIGAPTFSKAVQFGAETYHALRSLLEQKGFTASVADAGGLTPNLKSNTEALDLIIESIRLARYEPGQEIALCLDAAATSLSYKAHYELTQSHRGSVSPNTLASYYSSLVKQYPIVSIEDPLGEDDAMTWQQLTREIGDRVQIVGDDLFVTNPDFLQRGIENKLGNAVLIKVNQIGTLTETFKTIRIAQRANYNVIISGRSGETEDTFIADLAVGTGAGQIKAGSMCRSERVAKYNRLLKIESELENPVYAGPQLQQRLAQAAKL